MAKFSIDPTKDYYKSLYVNGEHDSTSWYIAKDIGFTKIIDSIERSKEHKLVWHSMLPKLPEDQVGEEQEYYHILKELYLKVIIHVGDATSPDVILGPYLVGDQEVSMTKGDETLEITTAKELGWLEFLNEEV